MEKSRAATIFRVSEKHTRRFDRIDPFNDNKVEGWICRKRNKNGGSLIIDTVNGKDTEQVIWATPKLQYPYKNVGSTDLINFKNQKISQVYISEKWNGMNILFYKYFDDKGNEVTSVKSKGTSFVSNSEVGNFLDLLEEALENSDDEFNDAMNYFTETKSIRAISFEMCGTKEPHLVKYDFDLKLKPLFMINENGQIKPYIVDKNNVYDFCKDDTKCINSQIHTLIKCHQNKAFDENEEYRKLNGLTIKYEYNHFSTEGYVLYVMDKDGFVIDKIMYKVKPKDIEEVHWQTFDDNMESRVKEAIDKCINREYTVNSENIQHELDMGLKEWDKFGKRIEKFLEKEGY